MTTTFELSILTFNVGLLRVKVFGKLLAEPTPYIEERFDRLSDAILVQGADIVALQEIYFPEHRKSLVRMLRATYPYAIGHDRRVWPNVGNGLMLFGKAPLRLFDYLRFSAVDLQERIFAGKGALLATAKVGNQAIAFANVHTTAGGFVESESEEANRWRAMNISEAVDRLRSQDADIRVLVGDFNAGPGASEINYDELIDNGFQDAALGQPAADEITWDPRNPLNSAGPHRHCPPQRIDHVFLDRTASMIPRPIHACVVFREPVVSTASGAVSLSDHYGLLVKLRWSASS